MMDYKIIDNFLPKEEFEFLRKIIIESSEMPYYFQPTINHHHDTSDSKFYMTHMLFDYNGKDYVHSNFYPYFKIISEKLDVKSLIRMKVNLYPKTDTLEVHEPHIDYEYLHKGCLFSFNTCDGFTILEDGTRIESVENRVLLFEAHRPHSSTNCTNAKARFNININYF